MPHTDAQQMPIIGKFIFDPKWFWIIHPYLMRRSIFGIDVIEVDATGSFVDQTTGCGIHTQ